MSRLSKWKLVFKVLPYLLVIVILKFTVHYLGWEFLGLGSLFAALVSANIFLMGFLISAVMTDYKEAEKIPGELACSIESITDECFILYQGKKSPEAKACLEFILNFLDSINKWLYKKERTKELLAEVAGFNDYFLKFEPQTQANFIVRIKQEQNVIRKLIHRIHTVRETSFVSTGYAIVEIITAILVTGLIFIKIDPINNSLHESIFFVFFVSFILIYMIYFLKDLDNPFGYYKTDNLVEEVSLKPLVDVKQRISDKFNQLS
ncbi:MAG: hypothetical protein NTV62_02895 [Candidatus Gribaldobacteria bacterium]|nr:hypothetical protein [Candidatus Gribaldobacteria bacterium]